MINIIFSSRKHHIQILIEPVKDLFLLINELQII